MISMLWMLGVWFYTSMWNYQSIMFHSVFLLVSFSKAEKKAFNTETQHMHLKTSTCSFFTLSAYALLA